MLKIHKSPEAENDLDEIWWYIAQDNPDSADKLLDEIEEASRKLARFSNIGRNRDELYPGLKSFPVAGPGNPYYSEAYRDIGDTIIHRCLSLFFHLSLV